MTSPAADPRAEQAVLDSLPDAHLRLRVRRDASGHVVDLTVVMANVSACLDLGVTAGRLVGASVADPAAIEGLQAVSDRLVHGARSGGRLRVDGVHLTPDRPERAFDLTGLATGDLLTLSWREVRDVSPGAGDGVPATVAEAAGAPGDPDPSSDPPDSGRTQGSLAPTESPFRAMFTDHDAVMLLVDTDSGRIVDANAAACRFYGYDRADLCGMGIADINALAPEEVTRRRLEAAARHQNAFVFPHRLADGRLRTVEVHSSPINVDRQHLLFSVIHDITEAESARVALVASEEQFRELAESIGDVVVSFDLDGRITWISPSVQRVLGHPPGALLGTRLSDWMHPDDAHDPLHHLVTDSDPTGPAGHYSCRTRYRTADGHYRWTDSRVTVRVDPTGVPFGGSSVLRDVDAQVRAEAALRDSQRWYRLLAENATDFVVVTDLDGALRWVSPSASRILGWRPEDVLGRSAAEFTHPDDLPVVADAQVRASAGQTPVLWRCRILTADGSWHWFASSTRPMHDDAGEVVGRVSGFQDVDAEIQARQEVQAAHERLQLVLDSSRLGLWDWNMQTGETVFNERWAQIVGYRLADLGPTSIDTWIMLTHPDDLASSDALIAAHAAGETEFYDIDCRMRHRDGHWVWVRDRGRIVERDADGRPLRMTGTHEDITALKQAVDALAASEDRFRVAMQSAPVGMAVLDLDRRVVQANPALCTLLGQEQDWLVGRRITDVLAEADAALDLRMRTRLRTAPDHGISVEHRVLRSDGAMVWVQQSISALRSPDGSVSGYVSQFVDMTAARESRLRLRAMAARDPLTGLLNRRELAQRIDYLMSRQQRHGTALAVLFIDLDGLKRVNDTHGHLVGDRVIAEVAERIRGAVRHDDVVARFGGDEFVVLLPQIHDVTDAQRIAEHIRAAAADPVVVDDVSLRVTYSIGVATTEAGGDAESALARADAAVYRAKREGRDRIVVDDAVREGSADRDAGAVPLATEG